MPLPEELARREIDGALVDAGWAVQDHRDLDLTAARGVAVREFPLQHGYGKADYMLYVDGVACGVLEAKPRGTTLTGVEPQAQKYADGVPAHVPAKVRPLPFLYISTGVETTFTNQLDPTPRSRPLFHFHRPETLADWLDAEPVGFPLLDGAPDPRSDLPATLRARLHQMPSVEEGNLWPAQIRAVRNLEVSLVADRPRALIQMATGSGKTFTAITSVYRLIKFAGAGRVLFLVDRDNLGVQAQKEFHQYVTPDDGRKFTDLYNVQRLTSNKLDPVARVVITTIQRLYSMLQDEPDLDPTMEAASQFATLDDLRREPVPVTYNPVLPVELFDFIVVDECHRSIYTLWRQVLEYFDAYLIGLTATPSKQTYGFFRKNLVMEYAHADAVADGVNVDFDVYKIRTRVTEQGAQLDAGPVETVAKRDRETRAVRWERLDEDLKYDADALDRTVVAEDQIRTVVQTFRDRLFTEIFPGRKEVPKTLIFAKDDSHADDIVRVVREELGKGNDFCQKITYRTGTARVVTKVVGPDGQEREKITYKSGGEVKAEDLLSSFRNSYDPRIVVTVDMIATGTDIKPLEIVMFMRAVKSRLFFEQMKGRGVRVIKATDLQAVTPDAPAKDRFVIIDCVGVCEQDLDESPPLERKRTVALDKLLGAVSEGTVDRDILSSLAGRLAKMDRRIGKEQRHALADLAGGFELSQIARAIVEALDPDRQIDEARRMAGLPEAAMPDPAQIAGAAKVLADAAVAPLRAGRAFRDALCRATGSVEQTIDQTTVDTLLDARIAPEIKQRLAETVVQGFERFVAEHRDEITALQVLYSRPYRHRLKHADVQALVDRIKAPPQSWTPDMLWRAYDALQHDKVRGAGAHRLLTDVVSLVRFALHHDGELVPYADRVEERFAAWMLQQENAGKRFTDEQRKWLEAIRDHVAGNVEIAMDDFEQAPFKKFGGMGRAYKVFGPEVEALLAELNEVLAA